MTSPSIHSAMQTFGKHPNVRCFAAAAGEVVMS